MNQVEKHAPAGRVGKVLPSCGSQRTITQLPPYPSQNRTSRFPTYGSSTLIRGRLSPIRVRSLAICFLPLRVADVCPPASERCEGLHSTGITRLHRYTGPHPITNPLLPASLLQLLWLTRLAPASQERVGPPG